MRIALDATYSVDAEPTGVGVYSAEIISGVAAAISDQPLVLAYRSHRFLRSFRQAIPGNCRRRVLWENRIAGRAELLHGLNQRLPAAPYRHRITTFHDLFVMSGDYSTPEFRRRFTRQAREAVSRSDLVIAVSRFTAGQLQDLLRVDAGRIRVIPHGVHSPDRMPSEQEREMLVLAVGAIQRRKNTARLVRAFRALPSPWRLALAGADGYGAEEAREAIRRSPAGDRIDVLGYVSATQLRDLFRRARIFAFPSLDEGFGIPILEAMAWGVPVLTSDRSAMPEVGGEAVVAVDPESEEALVEGLRVLAEDGELRSTLQQRGRKRIRSFRWERSVEMTLAAYRELLA